MVQSASSNNTLLYDIQGIVDSFLKGQGQDQLMQLTGSVQTESLSLANEDSINGIERQTNLDAIQSDEIPMWVRIQEKKNKIQAWEEKFRKIDESSYKNPCTLSDNAGEFPDILVGAKECEAPESRSVCCISLEISGLDESISQDGSDAIQSDETPMWVRVQEKRNRLLAQENICREMEDTIRTLSDERAELNQQHELVIQLADQALNDAEQQHQAWDQNLQTLQVLKQQAESLQTDLEESSQKFKNLEDVQASNLRALSDVQITHFIQEKRVKEVSDDLSKIESDRNKAREQLCTIHALQASISRSQEELLNQLNRAPSVTDSLMVRMWKNYSYLELRAQETVSKIKDQAKLLPTHIKNASLFLWDTFSFLSSATIRVISLIGQHILKTALKTADKAWDFAMRKWEELMIGTHTLVALGALSLCIFYVSRDSSSFAATAVCGFLLIRRISRTIGFT